MIQRRIWDTYRKGQEENHDLVTDAYMDVYRMSVSSIEKKEGREISFVEELGRYEAAYGDVVIGKRSPIEKEG